MSNALKRRIKQTADFESPAVEAMLNLMVAADHVRALVDRICSGFGITRGQYNVLRILRGAEREGHPRCEIAARMVESAPDVTRLLDRLENQELVLRERSDEDKRHSVARISEKGLRLLEEIEPELKAMHDALSERLSIAECVALSHICEKIYDEAA
jgi:DNA-binding MarR family transcriptional regulator